VAAGGAATGTAGEVTGHTLGAKVEVRFKEGAAAFAVASLRVAELPGVCARRARSAFRPSTARTVVCSCRGVGGGGTMAKWWAGASRSTAIEFR